MVPLSARDSECVDIVKTDTYSEQLSSHGAAATSGAQSLAFEKGAVVGGLRFKVFFPVTQDSEGSA